MTPDYFAPTNREEDDKIPKDDCGRISEESSILESSSNNNNGGGHYMFVLQLIGCNLSLRTSKCILGTKKPCALQDRADILGLINNYANSMEILRRGLGLKMLPWQ